MRINNKINIIIMLLVLFGVVNSGSIMISSTRIAYVDIQRIYNEIDEVGRARTELKALINKKKLEIEETEHAIASVRKKIKGSVPVGPGSAAPKPVSVPAPGSDRLTGLPGIDEIPDEASVDLPVKSSTGTVETSTQTLTSEQANAPQQQVKAPSTEVNELEKILKERENELKDLMVKSRKFIKEKEKELKYRIMGRIYETVKELSETGQYTVILDKELILFSEESVVDITDKVIRRLNER